MHTDLVEVLDRISPNLKLSGRHILPVLRRIQEAEPEREAVSRAVMAEFPGKTEKSVFRGMVAPTTTRLQLARGLAQKETFFLSPNGRGAVSPLAQGHEVLRRVITDYSVLDRGLTKDALDFFGTKRSRLKHEMPLLERKVKRFISQFIEFFDVSLPAAEDLEGDRLASLYGEGQVIEHLMNQDVRQGWLQEVLPRGKLLQVEQVRWALIEDLLQEGMIASTWFVDEVLRREWGAQKPVIDLWEASVRGDTKLAAGGKSYDGVLLRSEGDG